jgi:hypothetical protein
MRIHPSQDFRVNAASPGRWRSGEHTFTRYVVANDFPFVFSGGLREHPVIQEVDVVRPFSGLLLVVALALDEAFPLQLAQVVFDGRFVTLSSSANCWIFG